MQSLYKVRNGGTVWSRIAVCQRSKTANSRYRVGQINHPFVTIACMRRWQINAAFVLLAATGLFLATFAAAHCFNRGKGFPS
jgi:hypothetical protein